MSSRLRNLLSGTVPIVLVLIFFLLGFAYVSTYRESIRNNAYWVSCIAKWGDAVSQRNTALNDAAEFEAFQVGRRDAAMAVLVNNRNVDTATTAKAVRDWNAADADATEAKAKLAQARKDYPPPKLKKYCSRLKSVKLPKATRR